MVGCNLLSVSYLILDLNLHAGIKHIQFICLNNKEKLICSISSEAAVNQKLHVWLHIMRSKIAKFVVLWSIFLEFCI